MPVSDLCIRPCSSVSAFSSCTCSTTALVTASTHSCCCGGSRTGSRRSHHLASSGTPLSTTISHSRPRFLSSSVSKCSPRALPAAVIISATWWSSAHLSSTQSLKLTMALRGSPALAPVVGGSPEATICIRLVSSSSTSTSSSRWSSASASSSTSCTSTGGRAELVAASPGSSAEPLAVGLRAAELVPSPLS